MLTPAQVAFYAANGYVAPVRVLGTEAASGYRARVDRFIDESGGLVAARSVVRTKAHLRCPAILELVRLPAILDAVTDLIGPNVLCRSVSVFFKEPGDPTFVAWHQDVVYWRLDPPDVVSAWVALTDSNAENGALEVLPGSHREPVLPHGPSGNASNVLLYDQSILQPIDQGRTTMLTLGAGEISLHHVCIAHGSKPNRSAVRRVGVAIRYVAAHVRKLGPRRDSAILVRGVDRYGNFDPEPGSFAV